MSDETRASSTIVITGMHRSGTSLITSAFQLAGVDIGDRLIGRHDSNRRGHFEDIEFERFHERVVRRVDRNHLTVTRADVLELTSEEVQEAKALVARRHDRWLWGWKDPRTCLFLDFWHARLTNPHYVFVYRHPLEVVLSLLRRHLDEEVVEIVTDPMTALQAWVTYNQAMFDFYRRHRALCVLAHVHALAGDLPGTLALCARRFDVDLQSESAFHVYHPAELDQRRIPKEILVEFGSLAPLAATLYRQIDQAADLPQPAFEYLDPHPAAGEARDGRETLAEEFELLLTRLEPRAVLAGRRALDGLRRHELHISGVRGEALGERIRALECRVGELAARNTELEGQKTQLEAQNTELEAQNTELAAHDIELRTEMGLMKHHRAALEQRLDDAQRQFVDASMRVAAAEARADERGSDRADLQAQNAGLRDRQAHLETENTRLTWSLGEAGRNLAATQALVAAIGQTRAWRTAQVWYAFKRAVWRFLTGGANPS